MAIEPIGADGAIHVEGERRAFAGYVFELDEVTMNSEKFYLGFDKHSVAVLTSDGLRPLRARFDLRNASPTGFSWGYGGSGPAQLALAILADALEDDERALRLHQYFKWRFVGAIAGPCWAISLDEVRTIAAAIDADNADMAADAEAAKSAP